MLVSKNELFIYQSFNTKTSNNNRDNSLSSTRILCRGEKNSMSIENQLKRASEAETKLKS